MDIKHFGSPKVVPLFIRILRGGDLHFEGVPIEYLPLESFPVNRCYKQWARVIKHLNSDPIFRHKTPSIFCVLNPRALFTLDILQGLNSGNRDQEIDRPGDRRLALQKEIVHALTEATELIIDPDRELEFLTSSLRPLRTVLARHLKQTIS